MGSEIVTLIACKSGSPTLTKTLRSLSTCRIPESYAGTFIVENGGSPRLKSLVHSFGDALDTRYLHIPEKGKSRALNTALGTLDDELIFFSDDDVRFNRDVLWAYQQAGQEYGPGHFFGGPFNVDQEVSPPEWLRYYLPPSAKGCWYEDGSEIDDTFTDFLGFNWAAFASDLKLADGFDTSKGPGSATGSTGQETDMQRRLVAHGIKARYVPEARATHLVPRENSTPEWALRRSFRSGVKDGINYVRKNNYQRRLPPLWLIKANLNQLVRMLLDCTSERNYYDAKYWFFYHIGFVKGIRVPMD